MSGSAASSPPAAKSTSPGRTPRLYLVIGIAVVVVVVMALVAVSLYHPSSGGGGGSGTVLESSGATFEIPAGQYSAFEFTVGTSSEITGSFTTTYNTSVYLMTPTAYNGFIDSGGAKVNASWSSGLESSGTLAVPIPAGTWDLVFTDPNVLQTTNVHVTSDLAVRPA